MKISAAKFCAYFLFVLPIVTASLWRSIFLISRIQPSAAVQVSSHFAEVMDAVRRHDCSVFACLQARPASVFLWESERPAMCALFDTNMYIIRPTTVRSNRVRTKSFGYNRGADNCGPLLPCPKYADVYWTREDMGFLAVARVCRWRVYGD